MSTNKPRGFFLRELAGTVCRCGDPKRARETFCRGCYFRLPPTARRDLYKRIGEGYEEAYELADYLLAAGYDVREDA